MLGAHIACLVAACAAGCAEDPPPTVNSLVGVIHLHQYALGAHPWADFTAVPVPLTEGSDELLTLDYPETATEGGCSLHVQPTCTPQCTGKTWCAAPDTCAPLVPSASVNAGVLRITGSLVAPELTFSFHEGSGGYVSTPPPGPPLFAGGETLTLAGGRDAFALAGNVVAPLPITLTAPDPAAPLRLPEGGALAIRWAKAGSDRVSVSLNAEAGVGRSAYIRCRGGDSGAIDVPKALLAGLPPPPRDLRLEVERAGRRVIPTARAGSGVLFHAAHSTWRMWAE